MQLFFEVAEYKKKLFFIWQVFHLNSEKLIFPFDRRVFSDLIVLSFRFQL